MHEWSYKNDYTPVERRLDAARRPQGALQEAQHRGRARLHRRAGRAGGAALPQLRRADRVRGEAVHRVRRLHRHLPGRLPDHHAERRGGRPAHAPQGAGARTSTQPLYVSARAAADRARDGEGRGPVRALRAVRRALPDGGVGHAEVRPCTDAAMARGSRARHAEPSQARSDARKRFRRSRSPPSTAPARRAPTRCS